MSDGYGESGQYAGADSPPRDSYGGDMEYKESTPEPAPPAPEPASDYHKDDYLDKYRDDYPKDDYVDKYRDEYVPKATESYRDEHRDRTPSPVKDKDDLDVSTMLTGESGGENKNACVKKCMQVLHFLTDGPQEDRRLKKTDKDEEFVALLVKDEGLTGLMQEFPDKVLMTMAFCADDFAVGHFDDIKDHDVDHIYDLIDADGNGKLSKQEFLDALSGVDAPEEGTGEDVRDFLKTRQSALRLLLNIDLVSKVWDLFCGADREVPRDKFPNFILLLKRKALTSLEAAEHMRRRAFWGYGQDKTETPNAFWDESARLQSEGHNYNDFKKVGPLEFHQGWREDLWYYLCQNHQVFSLYFADVDHPLSEREKIVIEAFLWGFTFMMTGAHNWIAAGGLGDWLAVLGCDSQHVETCEDIDAIWQNGSWPLLWRPLGGIYALLFVSIPVLFLYRILFVMHLCPCAFGGAGEGEEKEWRCLAAIRKKMTLLGTIAGCVSLVLCVASWIFGVFLWAKWVTNGPSAVMTMLIYRLHTYLLQLLLILVMEFCPLPLPMEELYDSPEEGKVHVPAAWVGGPFWQWNRERWEFLSTWAEIQRDSEEGCDIQPPQSSSRYGAA
eukprot:Hpha_TRINITY_DN16636_c3_g4::TRINITY_DN16636_c3_g4_i1::g.182086::m.182086